MKLNKILQELEDIAETLDIKIIHGKGDFQGGYCILEKEIIIVINKLKPIEQQLQALVQAFSQLEISYIYIKPAIREIIKTMSSQHQLSSR